MEYFSANRHIDNQTRNAFAEAKNSLGMWTSEWSRGGRMPKLFFSESYSLFKTLSKDFLVWNLCLPSRRSWRFMVTVNSFYCKFPNSSVEKKKNLRSVFKALNTYNYRHFQFSKSTSTHKRKRETISNVLQTLQLLGYYSSQKIEIVLLFCFFLYGGDLLLRHFSCLLLLFKHSWRQSQYLKEN